MCIAIPFIIKKLVLSAKNKKKTTITTKNIELKMQNKTDTKDFSESNVKHNKSNIFISN